MQTLRLREAEPVEVPGTGWTLAATYVAHRIASTAGDRFARSMVSATLVLRDHGRQVHQAHLVVGARFEHGGLRFHFADAVGEELVVVVEDERPKGACSQAPSKADPMCPPK